MSHSLAASSSRPLRLRLRCDLTWRQHRYLGRHYWVVKDPLTLKYYRFEEEEHALLELLDGQRSLEQLRDEFERRFAPQKITLSEIHHFVGMMHQSALVISDAPGQAEKLVQRARQRSRSALLSKLSNVLCIRFRGVDPNRFLDGLNRRFGWLFSTPAVVACLLMAVAALILLGVEFEVFRSRLPAFQEFFAVRNWLLLAVTLAATKVLHEIGHGLMCKRFGGECHEMGVMLLVLTPCLYCNVSDSWMLPSKWRRAAIGAAGMYVEIVLASLCTFLWWFTEPGLFNSLCLNVMFVCSVSTLLFNANPLMRYDGYYILSDLIEIPNLRQKAGTILLRKLGAWMCGLPEPPDPFLPQKRQLFFALFSVASALYKWVIVFSILWFLYRVFEPYGVQILGQMMACLCLYGMLVSPLVRLLKFFRTPGRADQVKAGHVLTSGGLVFAAIMASLFVPLPYYIRVPAYVQPRNAEAVYVEMPGSLQKVHVRVGSRVDAGQKIVTLANPDLHLRVKEMVARKQQLELHVESLRKQALLGRDEAVFELDKLEPSIAALDEQLKERRADLARLIVHAPVAGVVLAAKRRAKRPDTSVRLASWTGLPTDRQNLGALLRQGELLCQIGDRSTLEAVLIVDQDQMEFLAAGQSIDLVLNQSPTERRSSRIEHVSQRPARTLPSSLSTKSGGTIDTHVDADGNERPVHTLYQATAALDDPQTRLFLGGVGEARIRAGSKTVGQRVWRYVCQTVRFEL